jgi:hypothetical protein
MVAGADYAHIWVDAVNGENTAVAGTEENPYKSISYALAVEAANATPDPWHVHVLPGSYDTDPGKPASEREVFPIELREGMLLRGISNQSCLIHGGYLQESHVPLIEGQDVENIGIDDLSLRQMSRVSGNGASLVLEECTGSIRRCIFQSNACAAGAGALLNACSLDFSECVFVDNSSPLVATASLEGSFIGCVFDDNEGGALNLPYFTGEITHCSFEGNSGFAIRAGTFQGNIADSTFIQNRGMGIEVSGTMTTDIYNCEFNGNTSHSIRAVVLNGSVYNSIFRNCNLAIGVYRGGELTVEGSLFHSGGHAITSGGSASGHLFQCTVLDTIFLENGRGGVSSTHGIVASWEHNNHLDLTVRNSLFAANRDLPAIHAGDRFTGVIEGNFFCSNHSQAISVPSNGGNSVLLRNNIFFANDYSDVRNTGHGIHLYMNNCGPQIENNIFWSLDGASDPAVWLRQDDQNALLSNNVFVQGDTAIYEHSDYDLPIANNDFLGITGDIIDRGGSGMGTDLSFIGLFLDNFENNIDSDPQFVGFDVARGSWTAEPAWDADAGLTTLTDSGASWTEDEFRGCLVNLSQVEGEFVYAFIEGNAATTLQVRGNWEPIVQSAQVYQIDDWHLRNDSPCIDTGLAGHGGDNDFEGDERPQGAGPDIGHDEFTEPAVVPRISGLTCELEGLTVNLAWVNHWGYDEIVIYRDAVEVISLAGDQDSYADVLTSPGEYVYNVVGTYGSASTPAVECEVYVPLPDLAALSCIPEGLDLELTWTNPCTYDYVEVWRNGARIPDGSGAEGSASYTDSEVGPGEFTYELVGVLGTLRSNALSCSLTVTLPAPENLDCTTTWLTYGLTWDNPVSYDSIRIVCDGEAVATLENTARSYQSTEAPGFHTFGVEGVRNAIGSTTTCELILEVPPPAFTSCTIDHYTATLRWENNADHTYDELLLSRGGELVATLPGTTTETTDEVPGPGAHVYEIAGVISGTASASDSCEVVTSYLPAPSGLTCPAAGFQVQLSWFNEHAYGQITIERNSVEIATVSGTTSSYTDTVTGPGTYNYTVTGAVDEYRATSGACEVEIIEIPHPANLTCTLVAQSVELNWTNPITYDTIQVERDGEVIAGSLSGGATTYTDASAPPGEHTYGVRGVLGEVTSDSESCQAVLPIAPPENLSCVGGPLRVDLTWTEPMAYDAVKIWRDGDELAEVAGGTEAYTDRLSEWGEYDYELRGIVGEDQSAAVGCPDVLVYEHAFARGDSNNDGDTDIADAIYILLYLFAGGDDPACKDAADVNGDAAIDIADAIRMLGYLMGGAEAPPSPFPECGVIDPPGSGLGCESFRACE